MRVATIDAYEKIESRFGIALPPTYMKWAQKGYTENSDTYLWVSEAEWIPAGEIPIYDLWRTPTIPGLIPFAFNGAGDNWCWNGSRQAEEGEYEVLFCYHDELLADAFAPTFPAWFYRRCLEFASGGLDKNRVDEARNHLRIWAERLEEIYTSSWSEHLASLADLDPFEYHHPKLRADLTMFGFITAMEVDSIIIQHFGNRFIEAKVAWGSY